MMETFSVVLISDEFYLHTETKFTINSNYKQGDRIQGEYMDQNIFLSFIDELVDGNLFFIILFKIHIALKYILSTRKSRLSNSNMVSVTVSLLSIYNISATTSCGAVTWMTSPSTFSNSLSRSRPSKICWRCFHSMKASSALSTFLSLGCGDLRNR